MYVTFYERIRYGPGAQYDPLPLEELLNVAIYKIIFLNTNDTFIHANIIFNNIEDRNKLKIFSQLVYVCHLFIFKVINQLKNE